MLNGYSLFREICIGSYFFLSGVEYAVILPTLNGYLTSLGAEQYFLGLVISAFSLTTLISAPIYGRISDKTRTSKSCIIVGNIFEIGGSFLYFTSTNKYMALSSRLIAGIGAGAASAIYGMITRTTSEEERTAAFSKLVLISLIGNIVGPAFNVFLNSIDFSIGPFPVNSFNAPGLCMVILWTIHTILVILSYKDPDINIPIQSPVTSGTATSNKPEPEYVITSSDDVTGDDVTSNDVTTSARSFKDEFFRDEIITCLTANFLVIFSQCVIETALAPVTKILFNWGGLENSYLYGGGGALVVVGFIPLMCIMKCVSDRAILLWGVIGTVGIYIMYTTIFLILRIEPYQVVTPWVFPVVLTAVGLLSLVLPYTSVAQASIFSKLTSVETQAFNQGVRLGSEGLARIIGPIWASSLSTLKGMPIMMGVNLLLNVISLVMILLSYDRLATPNEIGRVRTVTTLTLTCPSDLNSPSDRNGHNDNQDSSEELDESSPLLQV